MLSLASEWKVEEVVFKRLTGLANSNSWPASRINTLVNRKIENKISNSYEKMIKMQSEIKELNGNGQFHGY